MAKKIMAKKDTTWLYEKKAMQKQFISIMEYRMPIKDVPNGMNSIAFSTPEPAIYIKKENALTEKLPEHKARAIRFGLFAHEMCHQRFTDFMHLESIINELEPWEKPVFKHIFNVIEDPSIEALAPTLIGGYLLKSLKYAIKRNYDLARRINEIEDPFEQCMNAMVQFGDMGPIKGHFTFPLAKKCFFRVIPIMQEIMEIGNPQKRIDRCLDVFEELRPLWEADAKARYEELGECELEELMKTMLSGLGKGFAGGSGKGEEIDAEELADMADLSKGAKRTTTFKKLEDLDEEDRKVYEELMNPDEEILEAGEEEDEPSADGTPICSDNDLVVYSDEEADLSTLGDYDPEEYEMDIKGMDFFDRLIQTELELDASTNPTSREGEIPDFKEIDKKYSGRNYKCKNIIINLAEGTEPVAEIAYNKVVKKNLGHINSCYKKLRAIFAEEAEETEYRSSGKISLEKSASTTVTSKIFTKTVDPKDKSNMAVMLVIDESGSMCGSRIERAKEAAINLSEIFSKLGIPTYIMGFTADEQGAAAVHMHYTTWENKKSDRTKLTSITAKSNNFDGYSIRYASKLLNLRPETHKLMIVISDGQPACYSYSGDQGYRDTKDAIRESRGNGQAVLGVAIGADVDVLQKMYGNDFIFITTGEDLFTGIMRKFTAMVKKW